MSREINMPKLLGSGCVLQRGNQTRVWGWYEPGNRITVRFQEKEQETVTAQDGRFEVLLQCGQVGGPFTMTVKSEDGREKIIEEIYVGDVYVCAGQSNMELPMNRVRERFPKEPGCSAVHHYKVEECAKFCEPLQDHEKAEWNRCVGEALEDTSALGYFFGKMIAEKEGVPVGIINISKGGTPAEAWTSPEGLKEYPEFLAVREQFADDVYREAVFEEQDIKENGWHEFLREHEEESVQAPWKELQVPGYFSGKELPGFCGLLWLRRTFYVPEEMAGKCALLRLGTITDSDETYVNGVKVGETGYCFPPRRYGIPEGLLKAGENELFIRLECRDGKGRFTPDKPYEIQFETGEAINLAGSWKYQIRVVSEPAPELQFITRKPTGLFCGMTAPCLPMTVKGVLWYQGESNEREPEQYEALLKGMIIDWRKHWKQETLPFIIVQLPICGVDIAGGGAWALIRDAQRKAAELDDVAVTVNLDLGEWNDLHPLNKEGVAHRAYLAARHLIYKEDVIWQGPELTAYKKEKDGLRLFFDTKDGKALEITAGEVPECFEACGEDGVFYPVTAWTEDKSIFLRVRNPWAVRYAWSDCPKGGFLCNKEGIPGTPFLRVTKEEEEHEII